MARSRDSAPRPDERQASDAELRLVELLYGEVPDGEAEAVRARLEGDEALGGELAGLTALREALAELPDEEPPPAISAQLLHAAAVEHKRPAALPGAAAAGWWAALKRWLSPKNPALYAFATLILVAGVAGTLHLRGERSAAREPMVRSSAPQPAGAERPARERTVAPESAPGDDWTNAEPALTADEAPASAEPERDAVRPAETRTGAAAPGAGVETKHRPRAAPAGKSSTSAPVPAEPGAVGGTARNEAEGAGAPAKPAPSKKASGGPTAPPPPPRAQSPAAPRAGAGDVLDLGTEEAPLRQEPPPRRDADEAEADDAKKDKGGAGRVAALHRDATEAARRGDCERVARLGGEIRNLDPTYYERTFSKDEAVRACQRKAPVSK